MELFPKLIIFSDTKEVSTNSRNGNNPLHHIRSQCNKTRLQQQKKPKKIFKNMVTEQHLAEKPVGD
jgi:hypothetical protein